MRTQIATRMLAALNAKLLRLPQHWRSCLCTPCNRSSSHRHCHTAPLPRSHQARALPVDRAAKVHRVRDRHRARDVARSEAHLGRLVDEVVLVNTAAHQNAGAFQHSSDCGRGPCGAWHG
jgi:hypothetical protein